MSQTFVTESISLTCCQDMSLAAINKAKEIGINIALTIVDNAGVPKFYIRMDSAPLMAVDISRKKALTAVGFGIPTGEGWHSFIKDDPILNDGVQNIQDFMLLGGGLPIMINNQLVGAIGISGAHYKQDEACAEAAISSISATS